MVNLARLLVHVFFRQVQVENGAVIVSHRPTVLVANHRNGPVDGLLVMAALRRYPRFLGKATLFHIPFLWPFLKLAGVVPVHRVQDGGSTDRNDRAFAECNRVLARGGMMAIFPEGISHDRPALQPLRTGAARIALGAADWGASGLETVAVALVYDDKQRFRSRALVRVGVPQPIRPWMDHARADDHQAVRLLTDDLAERLRALGPDFASWSEANEMADIADIVVREESVLPGEVGLVDRERTVADLVRGWAQPVHAADLDRLGAAFTVYRRDLSMLGVSDAQIAASYRSGRLRRTFVLALAKVVVALPVAGLGVIIHVVPYLAVKQLSRTASNQGIRATVKVMGCFFVFGLTYALLGTLVGEAFGAVFGLLAAVCAPICGYLAVRMTERLRRMGGAVGGLRVVRAGQPVVASVLAHRAAVVGAARAVMSSPRPTLGEQPARNRVDSQPTVGP